MLDYLLLFFGSDFLRTMFYQIFIHYLLKTKWKSFGCGKHYLSKLQDVHYKSIDILQSIDNKMDNLEAVRVKCSYIFIIYLHAGNWVKVYSFPM